MVKATLYCALFSPPARACMTTAKLINLDVDFKYVDFTKNEHMTDEFIKLNPLHQIPVFVDTDGESYTDSHAIMAFMVSKYGKDEKLYPKDLSVRARVDQRLHFENGILFQVIKDLVARNVYGGEGDFNRKSIDSCHNAYGFLETFLKNNMYVVGTQMTIADISIHATIITLNLLIPIEKDKYPNIYAWMERMKSTPEYEETNLYGAQALCTSIKSIMAENKAKSS